MNRLVFAIVGHARQEQKIESAILSRTEVKWIFKLDPAGSQASDARMASYTARSSAQMSNGGCLRLISNKSIIRSGVLAVPQ